MQVRGLPYRSSPAEILAFFSGFQYLPDSLQVCMCVRCWQRVPVGVRMVEEMDGVGLCGIGLVSLQGSGLHLGICLLRRVESGIFWS